MILEGTIVGVDREAGEFYVLLVDPNGVRSRAVISMSKVKNLDDIVEGNGVSYDLDNASLTVRSLRRWTAQDEQNARRRGDRRPTFLDDLPA